MRFSKEEPVHFRFITNEAQCKLSLLKSLLPRLCHSTKYSMKFICSHYLSPLRVGKKSMRR